MKSTWIMAIAAVAGACGAVLSFMPPQILRDWGVAIGRHNDRVLVGILLLIMAEVAVYFLIKRGRR